jgi:hypothetical protein
MKVFYTILLLLFINKIQNRTYYRVERKLVCNISAATWIDTANNNTKRFYYVHSDKAIENYDFGVKLWGKGIEVRRGNGSEQLVGKLIDAIVIRDSDPTRGQDQYDKFFDEGNEVRFDPSIFLHDDNTKFAEYVYRHSWIQIQDNDDEWINFNASEINVYQHSETEKLATYPHFNIENPPNRKRSKRRKLVDQLMKNISHYVSFEEGRVDKNAKKIKTKAKRRINSMKI